MLRLKKFLETPYASQEYQKAIFQQKLETEYDKDELFNELYQNFFKT